MDTIAFTISGQAVTYGQAALGGFIFIALLLVAAIIMLWRGNSRRTAAEGEAAAQALRDSLGQQIQDRDNRIGQLEDREQRLIKSNTDLEARAASLQTQLDAQKRYADENLQRFLSARQQMTDEFKTIANDIMKSHGESFSKQNREQVDNLLKPLGLKITEFQTSLLREQTTMGERIRALSEESMRMATEANNLTRALKGNVQAQGAWGEMILSTILERSGLREGEQYFTQQTHAGDDGGRVRTDVEIVMPNGDRMIVDSKVSLTAFEAYSNCEDEAERAQHLVEHIASMRSHIKVLTSKQYHRHADSGLDFVFMFVPIEAAFSAAVTRDPGLIDHAIDQGVMITTPTTLMSALRTVRNVWDIEKRHQNAEEIADRAGALYDKIAGFLTNMQKLGGHIEKAQQSFDEAKGQLSEGRGNVVRQVEMLRELGAKTSKKLPADWASDEDSAIVRLATSTDDDEDDANDADTAARRSTES